MGSNMSQRFYIETFGCQMNEHDSEKIAGLLTHRGMVAVNSLEDADLFILNTCSIREKAARKVYSRLGEIKRHKKERNLIIGVVGCVAQQEGEQMVKSAPFVDLVVGTHMYHALPDLLDDIDGTGALQARVATDFSPDTSPAEIPQVIRRNEFRANITIMEGCNKHCSFCIVPHTRGRERSRPARLIVEDARHATEGGYVELMLLGQTVNSYRDPEYPRFRFADLLAQVAEIPGVRRVRFTSPHPREFDNRCIELIGRQETICNQVHLPLQSGSTAILKRMRRQYTRNGFLQLVEKFRQLPRPIALSTDIIVGFPGETKEDFQSTLDLVREVEFESMFSFKYSPRPTTEAHEWENDVAEEEKTRRLIALQELQRNIQLGLHRERYLGRHFEVLVEGKARDGIQSFGRTTTNKVVNFPGSPAPGSFVRVCVTGMGPNSLAGRQSGDTKHQNA